MRNRKLALGAIVVVIAAAAVALALGTSSGSAKSTGAFKAAWIYVGPHNDGGWSQAHDQGRLYVQKMLGSKVQTTYKELVPEGPQTCQVIDQLVRDGNQIIFSTSYGFQPCVLSEAKKYPKVKFEQATGDTQAANVSDYYGAGEDAIYLSGIAAGALTKTGLVGYVVPFAIPEVIRHTNAFTLGVQTVASGREGEDHLDELVARSGEGEEGGREPQGGGRRRDRPERRRPGDRPVRRVGRHPVGRLRLRREEVRAEAVADRRRLQLGPVLPRRDEGGDERDAGRASSGTAR